jgi:hypothetical protein
MTGTMIMIDCSACGAQHVQARAYNIDESIDFGPVMRTTWVVCQACGANFQSRVDVAALLPLDKEGRNAVLSIYTPLMARVLALVSLVIWILPAIGGAVTLVAVLMNRRSNIWKWFSYTGLGLSILLHAVLVGMNLINRMMGT